MLFSPRIALGDLAGLCRRLATALESGLALRRVFGREAASRASPTLRRKLEQISDQVNRGDSLYDAVVATGSYFPTLFREMLHVGEQSGRLPDVLYHLADHYDRQLTMRRQLLAGITWPLVQLAAAAAIVGLLIAVSGWIASITGQKVDILGLGLLGVGGLVIYATFLAAVAAVVFLVIQSVRRGALWARPLQRAFIRLPALGTALETLAMSRFAWTLHLTFGTGMPVGKALPLCLASTQNARYTEHSEAIVRQVRQGCEVSQALASAGVFPQEFLEALEVGEQSGRISESMAILSKQYHDRAQQALAALNVIAGFLVWAVVAGLIILVIFRLFSFYLGAINNALQL